MTGGKESDIYISTCAVRAEEHCQPNQSLALGLMPVERRRDTATQTNEEQGVRGKWTALFTSAMHHAEWRSEEKWIRRSFSRSPSEQANKEQQICIRHYSPLPDSAVLWQKHSVGVPKARGCRDSCAPPRSARALRALMLKCCVKQA